MVKPKALKKSEADKTARTKGMIDQVVRKVKLRRRRAMPAIKIVSIAKTIVHVVESRKTYDEHKKSTKTKPRKVVRSELQETGGRSKMSWSGITHGDHVERERYKFVQKVVEIEATPKVEKTEDKPIPEVTVVKTDSKGVEVSTPGTTKTDASGKENGA